MFMNWQIKMVVLPKVIYRFNIILGQNFNCLSPLEIYKLIPRFLWKREEPRIGKAISKRREKVKDSNLLTSTLKVTVIKTVWYWPKYRHTYQ